jgi:hypothetical protein
LAFLASFVDVVEHQRWLKPEQHNQYFKHPADREEIEEDITGSSVSVSISGYTQGT